MECSDNFDVGGQLLTRVKAFYRKASACVRVNGKQSEFSNRSGIEIRMCDVDMTLILLWMGI